MEDSVVQTPDAVKALEPEQKELTLEEYKKAMNAYFTVRRATVNECGHKFDTEAQPKNNCEYCWFAFFNSHGELVQTADEVFQKHGPETLDRTRGIKFRKMFTRFMATVAKFVEEESKKPCPKEGHTGFNFKCQECLNEARNQEGSE